MYKLLAAKNAMISFIFMNNLSGIESVLKYRQVNYTIFIVP